MAHHRIIARCCLSLVAVYLATSTAYAASVSAGVRKDYGRINFAFEAPTELSASNEGMAAILTFDKPLTASTDAIEKGLSAYVKGSKLSSDKRTLTLSFTRPMRLRQYLSGNNVGVDLIATGESPPPIPVLAEKKPEPIFTTKKETSTVKKSEKKPVKPERVSKLAKANIKRANETAKLPEKKVTAAAPKATAAKPSESEVTSYVAAAPAAAGPDAILTTKKPEATEHPQPKSETTAPTAQDPMLSTKPTTTEAPAVPVTSTKPATAPAPEKPAEKPAAEPVKPSSKELPFLVSARATKDGTVMNFPWKERTAATVFKRSRDIWIIFSKWQEINTGLLSTVMPKSVIRVQQYAYKGNTVLRLTTDGSIHPRVEQAGKGFGWDVILSGSITPAKTDTTLTVDALESTNRLIFNIFDVAQELRFFDPNSDEQFVIVPAYEIGRGFREERNFPQFSVLSTNQGLVLVNRLPDLAFTQTRAGLILSSEEGLVVSESLPVVAGSAPLVGASINTGVMIPYDQWYVDPKKYSETLFRRLEDITYSTKATRAESLMELVRLYMAYGMGPEALGVLNLIRKDYPQYFITNKLALLSAASNVMLNHMDSAASYLMAPELNDVEEAQLWRQVVTLYAPPQSMIQRLQQSIAQATPSAESDSVANTPGTTLPPDAAAAIVNPTRPQFQFLKFNKSYIHFYPPRIRQRLAIIAADAYLEDDQAEKALAVFDTLLRDNILEPVKLNAEFVLASAAEKKGEIEPALEMYDKLIKQTDDRYIAARARVAAALLRYKNEKMTAADAAEILELTRISWRGDKLERQMIEALITIYRESKQYDNLLRAKKAMLDSFPTDPNVVTVSGEMAELFENIFLNNLAPDMPPLTALSLFYEFKDLVPLGDKGDRMIQILADNLAKIDLLDRAIQLLENQVKNRSTGESRSKIGARLALLHLLNKHPQEALSVLEVTNFGANPVELQILRRQLTAQALSSLGKHDEALGVLTNDPTATGALLRLNVLWAMKDWTNVVNRAEDILAARPNLTDALTPTETEVLLKLALGYSFEGDLTQLRYLRDYYSSLIPDNAYKKIFEFLTTNTDTLEPKDFDQIAQQISNTESFLDIFKAKIAAGKLSEAIQ